MNRMLGRLFYKPRFLGGYPATIDGLNLPSQNAPRSMIGNLGAGLMLTTPKGDFFVYTTASRLTG